MPTRPADRRRPASRPLLEAIGLGRRFRGLAAVDDVSLDVRVGEIHAVIGTNGAGKSTLINLLSGELAPSAGRVRFAGHDVTRWSQPRRARAGLGRSYQRTTIFAEFSVLENCRLAAQAQAPRPWQVWERAAHDGRGIAVAERALAAAGLDGDGGRVASTLSHGAKRQLEIAMCLATAPRALLLDEPLAGMGARGDRPHAGAAAGAEGRRTRSCSSSTTWTPCFASPIASR